MFDIIVIGGGIAGISAAARLSGLGRVVVLERETALGHHASGRSAALFEETYGKPSVVALNRASRAHLATAQGGVLSPRGVLMIAHPGQEELFAREAAAMEMEPVGLDAALAHCPILRPAAVARAGWHGGAQDIDTDKLIQDFVRDLRAGGGDIRLRAEVSAIDRTATGWAVTTPAGPVEGRLLVNAAGAWVDRIAAQAGIAPLGVTPLRRSMARIPAPSGHDVSRWPMVLGVAEDWYFKPDAGALIVSPADEDPAEPHDAWADDMVLAEGLARFEDHVTVPVTRLIAAWAGLRTFAPDRQLVIGPDPADPAFWWCAGQGGYGFQTAPAASALLADLVAGRPPAIGADIAAAVSPARFDRPC